MAVLRVWLVAAVFVWLAGCGGGGGSGSNATAPAPAPSADEPTLALTGQSRIYATLTLSAAAQLQNLAQLTVDISQRMATAGVANPLTIRCPINGSLSLRLLDRDGNGRASKGDQITAVFEQCSLPLLQLSATGTAVVELQTGSSSGLDTELRGQLQVVETLRLERTGYRTSFGWTPSGVRGSMAVTWTAREASTRLTIQSTAADDLHFGASPSLGTPAIELRKIDTVKDVRFDDSSIVHSLGFQLMVGTGRAVVRPTPPLTLDLGGIPRSGSVTVLGAGGQSLQISGPGTFGTSWNVDTLAANGSVLETLVISADVEQGTLSWDGRHTVTTTYGSGYSAGAYVEGPSNTVLDLNDPSAPDPIFLHPLTRARADDAELVLRVQARARYINPPAGFHWRLRDLYTGFDAAVPAWNIPLRATLDGALFRLVATAPLRYGQRYSLEASQDGVDWVTSHELPLVDGTTQRLGPGMTAVEMRSTLLVTAPRSRRAVVSAQTSTLLSPTANTTDGATVVRWQWEQLDGPVLVLETPDQRETLARLPAGGPRAFGKSTLQITATDSLGRTQRARVVVHNGDTAANGAIHYRESRYNGLRERAVQLEGNIVTALDRGYDPFPLDAYDLRADSSGGQRLSQMLRMPDGRPMAVGRYEAAVSLPVRPGVAYIACGFLLDCPEGSSGQFEVLEVETAPDGTIRRLAVDYETSSPSSATAWAVRGSYRLNSTLAVRP